MRRIIYFVVLIHFFALSIMPPQGFAQTLSAVGLMPAPGAMVNLTGEYTPAYLWGMGIHANEPFKFDFLIHRGDSNLNVQQKQDEYTKLIKYFLAALAVPDTDQWVNLSPYEKDRMIPDNFGLTEMGRDLLAQDYLLKQLTSSLTNPDSEPGRKFWAGLYERAYQKFGTTDIPTDTFNKVWIMPGKAVVFEKNNMVHVLENHLKVMTDKDYLAIKNNASGLQLTETDQLSGITADVLKEVIVPAIEEEVNKGKSFAPLRQVYSGMLLATWYKRALKESILGQLYADKGKLKGINQDPQSNQEIFEKYVQAFQKGAFNMIRVDADRNSQELIPRKYFSGGAQAYAEHPITRADAGADAVAVADASQTLDSVKVQVEAAQVDASQFPQLALSDYGAISRFTNVIFHHVLIQTARQQKLRTVDADWIRQLMTDYLDKPQVKEAFVELITQTSSGENKSARAAVYAAIFLRYFPTISSLVNTELSADVGIVVRDIKLDPKVIDSFYQDIRQEATNTFNAAQPASIRAAVASGFILEAVREIQQDLRKVYSDIPDSTDPQRRQAFHKELEGLSLIILRMWVQRRQKGEPFYSAPYNDRNEHSESYISYQRLSKGVKWMLGQSVLGRAFPDIILREKDLMQLMQTLALVMSKQRAIGGDRARYAQAIVDIQQEQARLRAAGKKADIPTAISNLIEQERVEAKVFDTFLQLFDIKLKDYQEWEIILKPTLSLDELLSLADVNLMKLLTGRFWLGRVLIGAKPPDAIFETLESNASNKGGIDFAQSNLDLEIKRDGNGVILPVGQQELDNIRIDGLVPMILDIRPAIGTPLLSLTHPEGARAVPS